MSSQGPQGSQGQSLAAAGAKTYELRVPKKGDRKVFVSKFSNSLGIDFGTWKKSAPEFVREGAQNDIRVQTVAEDIISPKAGAGSEFGKDKRDEARKKKYTRRARSDDVPWIMTDTVSKKKYRGNKEGGVQDNSSYYIFTTVGGAIEAYPVSEWFNFTPIQRYKALNEDEAEEAFERRDKVFNYFNIMYQKRLKTTGEEGEDGGEDGGGDGKSGGGSRRQGLKIKDDDEEDGPANMSESDEDGTAEDTSAMGGSKSVKGNAKRKPKAPVKKRKQPKDTEGDVEPGDDSDDGDFETRELDYETSESEDEMEEVPEHGTATKGVEEEVEEMDINDEDEEDNEGNDLEGKDNSADDATVNSDSSNDEEDIDAIADSKIPAKRIQPNEAGSNTPSDKNNHSAKNSVAKGTKRKQDSASTSQAGPSSKKPKSVRPSGTEGTSTSFDAKLDEEALVRNYLKRKPITSKELLRKLTKRGVRTENLGDIIKRLNPDKTTHGGKLMLHLKT